MGPGYQRESFFRARGIAKDITHELSTQIAPGMREQDAHALYKTLLAKFGIEKQWHPPKLRFGPNTLRSFREPSQDYVLKERDIYFIDIGPVIDGHEADYGETFVLGNDPALRTLTEASRGVFREVEEYWQKTSSTGIELYRFAEECAQARGFELNRSSSGHRIGDFPHHVHFQGKLMDVREVVVPDAWILEIHLQNPGIQAGAFFEDVLCLLAHAN